MEHFDRLLTIADLARRWGVSVSKLRQTPKHLLPPMVKLPGSRLVRMREEDVEKHEWDNRHVTPPPEWLKSDNGWDSVVGRRRTRGRPRKDGLPSTTGKDGPDIAEQQKTVSPAGAKGVPVHDSQARCEDTTHPLRTEKDVGFGGGIRPNVDSRLPPKSRPPASLPQREGTSSPGIGSGDQRSESHREEVSGRPEDQSHASLSRDRSKS